MAAAAVVYHELDWETRIWISDMKAMRDRRSVGLENPSVAWQNLRPEAGPMRERFEEH